MRKILITFLLIFTAGYVSAQIPKDTITLKHSGYTTLWSSTLDYPLMVQWWDTKERCDCERIPRKDDFGPDPLLKKKQIFRLNMTQLIKLKKQKI
jgi:hypothetical protein